MENKVQYQTKYLVLGLQCAATNRVGSPTKALDRALPPPTGFKVFPGQLVPFLNVLDREER